MFFLGEYQVKRRDVMIAGAAATMAVSTSQKSSLAKEQERLKLTAELCESFVGPTFIATWPFGKASCDRGKAVYQDAGNMRDAIELGIQVTELDESNASVGVGGAPNANGIVQLDACFMDGRRQTAGSVAAIEDFPNPISVARRVMEESKHVMLVGQDAGKFAASQGFERKNILTESAKRKWLAWRAQNPAGKAKLEHGTHDTIAMLGVGSDQHIVGGCSTSGLAYKTPGRVGDSPLIGGGLYVDGAVGAAGATGIGENILRYCGSFLTVEFMRQGMTPTEACEATIKRIADGEQKAPKDLSVNFIAINKDGVVGGAGTDNFHFAVTDARKSVVIATKPIR